MGFWKRIKNFFWFPPEKPRRSSLRIVFWSVLALFFGFVSLGASVDAIRGDKSQLPSDSTAVSQPPSSGNTDSSSNDGTSTPKPTIDNTTVNDFYGLDEQTQTALLDAALRHIHIHANICTEVAMRITFQDVGNSVINVYPRTLKQASAAYHEPVLSPCKH
jgi:hypothetical protein